MFFTTFRIEEDPLKNKLGLKYAVHDEDSEFRISFSASISKLSKIPWTSQKNKRPDDVQKRLGMDLSHST